MNGLPDTTPTNRPGPRWFVRGVAVLVGLVNLGVVLAVIRAQRSAGLPPDPNRPPFEEVTLIEALARVLVAMLSGLAASEIVLRVLGRWVFSERFVQRYAAAAWGVFLGGVLMGGLLTAVIILGNEHYPFAVRVSAVPLLGLYGVMVGGVLGLVEGLVLALPLAYILGRFRNGG